MTSGSKSWTAGKSTGAGALTGVSQKASILDYTITLPTGQYCGIFTTGAWSISWVDTKKTATNINIFSVPWIS